jgi:hypothetical protein
MPVGKWASKEGGSVKRSLKGLVAAGAAVSMMAVTAPGASAGPADVPGCTSVLLGEAGGWIPWSMPSEPVKVEYTPPGTVSVDADWPVGVVTNIAGDVVAWVICVA